MAEGELWSEGVAMRDSEYEPPGDGLKLRGEKISSIATIASGLAIPLNI